MTEVSTARTLYQWFDRSAQLHADAPALEVGGQVLTYAELRRCAEATASAIVAANGSVPGRVALLAGRGLAAFAGYLAVQRLGATVVPLNPAHPLTRNEMICGSIACDVLFVDDHVAELGGLADAV